MDWTWVSCIGRRILYCLSHYGSPVSLQIFPFFPPVWNNLPLHKLHHFSSITMHHHASGKEPACQSRRHKRHGFDPWVGKIPWRRKWQPAPVFLSEKSNGQRSLVGYSPWVCTELDAIEVTQHASLRAQLVPQPLGCALCCDLILLVQLTCLRLYSFNRLLVPSVQVWRQLTEKVEVNRNCNFYFLSITCNTVFLTSIPQQPSFSHLLLLQTRNTNTLLQDINDWEKQSLKTHPGISLAVKWLRLCASNSEDLSLIPGRGTKIPHAVGCGQKIKKNFINEKKPHPIIGDSLYYSVYICICFKFFSMIFSKTTENHSNDIRKQISVWILSQREKRGGNVFME